jgi:TolB-like protein/tetratricopeptide (TPR) repeat protein/tRNA A-37 threonylcarbamoyl transferase component Bud32
VTDLQAQLQAGLAGQYALERELGRGGMATVFLAQDLKHKRAVALKVLLPDLAASVGAERFHREIEIAARLQHPHILTVLDSGEAAGQLWFTMPFVEGQSLRDRLHREHQLPVEDALRIAREAARALDYAHEQGVVHRDVKPENILLTRRGDVLVADFGIARALGGGTETLTQTGMAVGTPAYMSPEQAAGGQVDGRSDLYSLGCVLYETLAGEVPYTGPTAQAIVAKRFSDPPPSVRRVRPTVPEAVDQAVQRVLALVPADRFSTGMEFAHALQGPVTTPTATPTVMTPPAPNWTTPAPPAPAPAVAAPARSRRPVPVAALMLALGFAIGLGVLFAWRRSHGGAEESVGLKRLAVLPFENLGDSADGYFADGITDEVRGRLAAVPGLEVVAGRSSNDYRRTTKPLPEIARDLAVDYILVGKIRWERGGGGASRVRVSPELIKITPGAAPTTKWAQPFDASLTDVFQVQADIAGRVTQSLNLALGAGAPTAQAARPTTSIDAYDFYLQGNEYYERQEMSDVRLALELYRRAVGLDSNFALAWARLARAEAFVYWFGDRSAGQLTRVEQAARRALALAPDLAEAHLAMGYYYYWGLREYGEALDEFAAAAKREPNNAEAAYVSGLVLRRQAKWDQAIASFRHAVELDPRSVENLFELSSVHFFTRNYAEAERVADRATALAPDSPNLYALRTMLYLNWEGSLEKPRRLMREALGRFDFARFGSTQTFGDCFDLLAADDAYQAEVARLTPAAFSGVPLSYFFFKAIVYHRRGETTKWRAYADSARNEALATIRRHEEVYFTYTTLAVASAYLGRADEAVEAGKQALEQLPPSKDAMFGPEAYITLAQVYMVLGKPDAAVEQLRSALAIPSYLSAGRLRADPLWAPLKGNAAFQRLVAGK